MPKDEKRRQLAELINSHPILSEAPEDRIKSGHYLPFCKLVLEYQGFYQELQHQTDCEFEKENYVISENNEDKLMPGANINVYDNYAFMSAYRKSLLKYSISAGKFLPYFKVVYRNELSREIHKTYLIKYNSVYSVGEKQTRKLKTILKMLKEKQIGLNLLPPDFYSTYCKYVDMDEDEFKELVNLAYVMYAVDPSTTYDDDENEYFDYTNFASDTHSENKFTEIEHIDALCAFLDLVADIDQQEYPKLFMTNALLTPLKDDNVSLNAQKEYQSAMEEKEYLLWDKIFIPEYLKYVYEPKPVPDSVINLVKGRLRKKLNNAAIAEYKNVSTAAVSKNSKRFWSQIRSDKAKRIMELLS